jgi:3'-phosphoadenosine 5'-phosphosulfate sulfotransferase (PAPS reductase)/FAD synthetase
MPFMDGEEVVAGMQAKAELVIKEVMAEFTISHVCAAFSGGNDSIVATHWAMNRFPGCVAITADTQIGLKAARDHQQAVCDLFKWDREVAAPVVEGPPPTWSGDPWVDGQTSYEEFVFNHGFPGPSQHARMYQRLKQRAFRIIKKRLGKRPQRSRILVISGIRADESAIRAGYKRAFMEEPSECFVWCNPFYYCSAADFATYRDEFGLPFNPVKAKCGISGECCCGSFAAVGEREAYRQVEPEFAEYLDQIEAKVRQKFPWGWGETQPKW